MSGARQVSGSNRQTYASVMREAAYEEPTAVGGKLDAEVLPPERLELRVAQLRQPGDLLQNR